MPSLWKKQKGNRISRLVSDFQTPPKRGGSLVVETGFPTSIVDLFVKNRDRLKKPSKRKYRTSSTTTRENEEQPYLVSYPPVVLSKLEVPSFSNDEKTQENVAHVENSGVRVEEIVGNNKSYNLCVDESVSKDKDSSCLVDASSPDCCEYEDVGQEEGGDFRKVVSMSILKGGFAAAVVVVALYTRSFVVEITLGALLLLLLEFVGKFVVGFLSSCKDNDDDRKLLGFSLGWMKSKQGKGKLVQNRILSRAIRIGAKELEDGESMVVFEGGEENDDDNGVVLQWEVNNDTTFARVIEQGDGIGIDSKGEIEQANSRAFLIEESSCLDEAGRSKLVCEIEVLDPNVCVMTRNSYYDGPGGYCEFRSRKGTLRREEKEDDVKMKKENKFWKKFVLKRVNKRKKLKNGKDQREAGYDIDGEMIEDCVEEVTAELEEVVEREEDELEMADGEMSSSSLSSCEEEWAVRPFGTSNDGYSTMLQIDNGNSKSCWLLMKQDLSLRYLTIFGIALAGLIQGKIFALVLTVICCFIFKIIKS